MASRAARATNGNPTAEPSKVRRRMGFAHRAILAGALGFAAAFVVACGGGSGLLSGDQANTLKSQLDQVSSELSSGSCNGVSSATNELSSAVANLPTSVNATLRNNLS